MADGPLDPNNNPEINANINFDKARLSNDVEQTFDRSLDNVRKSFEKSFGKSIQAMSDEFGKGMKEAIGKASKVQKDYYNLIATKERKHFDKMKADYNKIGKILTANVKREESSRKSIYSLAKQQQRDLSKEEVKRIEQSLQKEKSAIEQLTNLKRRKLSELKEAEFRAMASEGKVGLGGRIANQFTSSNIAKSAGGLVGNVPIIGKFLKGLNLASGAMTALLAIATKLFSTFIGRRRDFARLGASFRNAGLAAEETDDAVDTLTKSFNQLNLNNLGISPGELRREILLPLAEYPSALKELSDETGDAATRAVRLTAALGDVGKSIPEAIRSIGEASKDQAIDTEEYIRMYKIARGHSQGAVRGFDMSMNALLNMNKALRSVTFDTSESQKMFGFMSSTLKSFTGELELSDQEVADFMMTLAQGTANLGFDKVAGMFAMVNDRMPTGEDFAKLAEDGGLFALQMQTLGKIMGDDLPDKLKDLNTGQLATLRKSMDQFGVSIPDSRMSHFLDLLNKTQDALSKGGLDAFNAEAENLLGNLEMGQDSFEDAVRRGEKTLGDMVSPISKIATAIDRLADNAVGIPAVARTMTKLVSVMEKLANPGRTLKESMSGSDWLDWGGQRIPIARPENLDRNARGEIVGARGGNKRMLDSDQWKPL